jgi:excinuclease ABC subunit C
MMKPLEILKEKVAQFPTGPGVYLWRDAQDKVIYVGKAKNLRARVRSYFNDDRLAEAKNGTMVETARDVSYILVDNEKEALGLENNLIKQHRPRFNVLLRDDKTYPYIKLTKEKFPRVYVTRRLRKDGQYFGPYFPGNLAHRLNHFIHRHFKIPSCKVDFNRKHTHPCLEYHINRCHGPCVEGLVSIETYQRSVEDVRRFLDGRLKDLTSGLRGRMNEAAENLEFEKAASLRNLITTVEEMEQRQKVASADGDDIDIFAYHAEPPLVAVNLFHLRRGRIVDRRELFWEDQQAFDAGEFFQQLLIQVYLNQPHVPAMIHVPLEFEDREILEELLTEKRGRKCTISTPQRGGKKAMLGLVETNAKHSFEQRFRVLKPSSEAIKEALRDALNLEEAPRRIECFDISHIQGTDKVASMVVWEDGRMKKADYRKFIIKSVEGNNDFASMAEVVTRRYSRLKDEGAVFPGLILIDGGLGQLHAAADALEAIGIINQPVASIAKREELIYVLGQEDEPVYLERHNPVLHLVQMIRDEAHRFAVTFHRTRRNASRLTSELEEIPGIGKVTLGKLLRAFGSPEQVQAAGFEALAQVAGPAAAKKVLQYYENPPETASPLPAESISGKK